MAELPAIARALRELAGGSWKVDLSALLGLLPVIGAVKPGLTQASNPGLPPHGVAGFFTSGAGPSVVGPGASLTGSLNVQPNEYPLAILVGVQWQVLNSNLAAVDYQFDMPAPGDPFIGASDITVQIEGSMNSTTFGTDFSIAASSQTFLASFSLWTTPNFHDGRWATTHIALKNLDVANSISAFFSGCYIGVPLIQTLNGGTSGAEFA